MLHEYCGSLDFMKRMNETEKSVCKILKEHNVHSMKPTLTGSFYQS